MTDNKYPYNEIYDKKALTELAEDKILDFDKEINLEEIDTTIDYYMHQEMFCSSFCEGVSSFLNTTNDSQNIKRILKEKYSEQGQCVDRARKRIDNWVDGNVGTDYSDRHNLYDFCMILKMTINQTANFFYKYFRTLPFNFKDRIDMIYYFCINNCKKIEDAKHLIEETNDLILNEKNEIATISNMNKINNITEKNELIDFIEHYCCSKETQFSTIRKEITTLIERIYSRRHQKDSNNKLNINRFYEEIFGFSVNQSISKKETMSKAFKRNFPKNGDLNRIINGEYVSYEMIRKTFMILFFYEYYDSIELSDNVYKVSEYLEEFYQQLNDKLYACGLMPLYVRDAFTMTILQCAKCEDPILKFQEYLE